MGKYVSLIILGLFVSTVSFKLQANKFVLNAVSNYVIKHDQLTVRNIANAGASVALNALSTNVNASQPVKDIQLYNGTYSYFFERQSEDASLGITEIRATSIAHYNNLVDTVVVLLTRPSFSKFAYFTNHEGNIWFSTGDTIHGPCHTNTYFQMAGEPVFWGKVSSSKVYNKNSPYRKSYWGPTNPQFKGGTEWGVPKLPMPTEIPQDLIDAAKNGGIYVNKKNSWVEFKANGTVKIAAKYSSKPPKPYEYKVYNLSSTNGVIYFHYSSNRPTVRVEGTVNGKVTLGTRGYVRITSDIYYADNPMTNPTSNDMLGIVAAKDIIVYDNQHDKDRTIQATIMTLNTATAANKNFWVKNYKRDRYGKLHLLGGLIQNSRGAVGLVGNQWSRKGYLKDYRWDPRLQNLSPPNFPMLFVLRKIAWWD